MDIGILVASHSHEHAVAPSNREVVSEGLPLVLHNGFSLAHTLWLCKECLLSRVKVCVLELGIAQLNVALFESVFDIFGCVCVKHVWRGQSALSDTIAIGSIFAIG